MKEEKGFIEILVIFVFCAIMWIGIPLLMGIATVEFAKYAEDRLGDNQNTEVGVLVAPPSGPMCEEDEEDDYDIGW